MIKAMIKRPVVLLSALLLIGWSAGNAQKATITEEQRTLLTYPFDDPDPVPILTSNTKIYPYFKYEGYSLEGREEEWKVVKLENDYVEVYVLPQVGGKVWGAIEKSTGEEFIYRNEVMKFRNIAMRGPWTSGGIEFNFGIIGHHPSTATPVDYVLEENEDGSVSCTVGNIDLPSRTQWRVEIRLPADKAYFETRVTWYNPTPLHQAYYNWMTGAAATGEDLEFYTPGDQYLRHSGEALPWPYDERGRDLSKYRENAFGSSKSYHVVGEYNDFFGGYFQNAGYGFGHWAPYEEMPGQKLWLWALSRAGGIWEDLLTDTDGQYIEFQAGRLLVQYSPGSHDNPITQATFEPYTTDQWREIWFPVKAIGGLSDVSEQAVLHVEQQGDGIEVGINALARVSGTLEVSTGDRVIFRQEVDLPPMAVLTRKVPLNDAGAYEVRIPELDLHFSSEVSGRKIDRPFDSGDWPAGESSAEKTYRTGLEDRKFRVFDGAMEKFRQSLELDLYHTGAMVGLAHLHYDRGEYETGLTYARKALQLDTYDPHANYAAGILYRWLGDLVNARENFGWAARSMTYRSVAYAQMAELSLAEGDLAQAALYANKALDFNRFNVNALQVLAIRARKAEDEQAARRYLAALREIDPLLHFYWFEQYLRTEESEDRARFVASHRSELPYQTFLELAIRYASLGLPHEAMQVLDMAPQHPLIDLWRTYLKQDDQSGYFTGVTDMPADFVFPYRRETLNVLQWASEHSDHWKIKYYRALNLWGKGRQAEAAQWMRQCGETPDFAYFYLSRADLLQKEEGRDPLSDLQKARRLESSDWRTWHALTEYYFQKRMFDEAEQTAREAYQKFPDSYVMGMDLARVQVYAGEYESAGQLLESLQVLPFEGASEGRRLFAWAHTGRALDLMANQEYGGAIEALNKAKQWPESLGVGRPHDPEERLQNYLLARCYEATGDWKKAGEIRKEIVTRTRNRLEQRSPLHLLGLRLAEQETAYEIAELLANMSHAGSPATRWVLDRFSHRKSKGGPPAGDRPDMVLLLRALE